MAETEFTTLSSKFYAAQDAYDQNADYRQARDVNKAKSFQTACTRLLGLLPAQTRLGNRHEMQFRLQTYENALDQVNRWIVQNDPQSRTQPRVANVFSVENFRG